METTTLPVNRWLTKEISLFRDAADAAIQGKGSLIDALHQALDCAGLMCMGADVFMLSVGEMKSLQRFLSLAVINYDNCYSTWCLRQNARDRRVIPLLDMANICSRIENTVMVLNCGLALGIVNEVAH